MLGFVAIGIVIEEIQWVLDHHLILQNHVIKGSFGFMGRSPLR